MGEREDRPGCHSTRDWERGVGGGGGPLVSSPLPHPIAVLNVPEQKKAAKKIFPLHIYLDLREESN